MSTGPFASPMRRPPHSCRRGLFPRLGLAAVQALLVLASACADQHGPRRPAGAAPPAPDYVLIPGRPAGPDKAGDDGVAHDPPAFRIDRTEVTAGNYALCLGAGACGGEDLLLHDGEAGAQCNVGAAGKERHPANCVSRAGGERYCSWVGGRLPSEDEWEQAARGQEERAYPWGEEFVPFRANCDEAACGDGFFFSAPVGMFPAGASPYGPLDLAGNVMEWTASTPTAAIGYVTAEVNRDGDPYFVLKGGSWKSFGLSMKSTEMDFYAAHTMLPEAGFRCAYDVHGEVAQ